MFQFDMVSLVYWVSEKEFTYLKYLNFVCINDSHSSEIIIDVLRPKPSEDGFKERELKMKHDIILWLAKLLVWSYEVCIFGQASIEHGLLLFLIVRSITKGIKHKTRG